MGDENLTVAVIESPGFISVPGKTRFARRSCILRIPTHFGQLSDFGRTVIRFISDAVPI